VGIFSFTSSYAVKHKDDELYSFHNLGENKLDVISKLPFLSTFIIPPEQFQDGCYGRLFLFLIKTDLGYQKYI